jgi:hypothetical protein
MADSAYRLIPGRMMPEVTLVTRQGRSINLGASRNRNNLLLVFLGAEAIQKAQPFMQALAQTEAEFTAETTEVFVIVPSHELVEAADDAYPEIPFLIVHQRPMQAEIMDPTGDAVYPAAFVLVDRFGEIISTWRLAIKDLAAEAVQRTIRDALAEVRFIELQCPE